MSAPTSAHRVERPLLLDLFATPEELAECGAEGAAIQALGGATAKLQLADKQARLAVALPSRSLTEQRWIVEQLLRHVASLGGFSSAELRASAEVSADAVLAIGLDVRMRVGEVSAPSAIADELARIGDLEGGYQAWVDEDPATRTSLAIASDIETWAGGHDDVEVEVMAEPELESLGLRLLLAVGAGSQASPARLVIARYTPSASSSSAATEAPLMLLGKGITFDTGGINVKPYESFVPMMKNDMAGAALAYHVFKGLVEARHAAPLVLVIPTCENAIGAASMRPGAIVRSYRGQTVRIDHTDAEGRLVLADALAYASDTYEPSQIICFATLTTSALIAYGPYATPVHTFVGSDARLESELRTAAAACGEDLHFFPERIWHFEANRDREADLRNTARLPGNASRGAGSRNAAHFLRHFSDRPLMHLDIFASAWNWAGDAPGAGYGATGAPLRTLLRGLSGK